MRTFATIMSLLNRTMRTKLPFLFFFVALCGFLSPTANAEVLLTNSIPSEGTQVSILIASPSADEVYTVYGHAGLRVRNDSIGLDATFNWGIFSFDEGNFEIRFALGKARYTVEVEPTSYYMGNYYNRGSRISELVIDIRPEELARLWDYLMWNIRPENKQYHYSFFYDNCSNRVVNILVEAIGGQLHLPEGEPMSFRDIINYAEASKPWLVFGTDLSVASPADLVQTEETQLFLPSRVLALLPEATIVMPDGEERRVVSAIYEYKSPLEHETLNELAKRPIPMPFVVSILWFLMILTLIVLDVRHGRTSRFVRFALTSSEALTLFVAGLVGVLIFFLSFISIHPCMRPNYNLLVFHPLLLLGGLILTFLIPTRSRQSKVVKMLRRYFHYANLLLILIFIAFSWALPQHFNMAMYGFALSLALISAHILWVDYKKTEKSN